MTDKQNLAKNNSKVMKAFFAWIFIKKLREKIAKFKN